jgi:hypothetical protein
VVDVVYEYGLEWIGNSNIWLIESDPPRRGKEDFDQKNTNGLLYQGTDSAKRSDVLWFAASSATAPGLCVINWVPQFGCQKKHKRKKPWPCIVFEARSGLLKMLAAFSARLVLTWHSFIFWTSESLEADRWTFWWFSSQCRLIFH